MPVRPRNSNWALIVTGKGIYVNNAHQKFSFFCPKTSQIRTQHIEKVIFVSGIIFRNITKPDILC
jgi:hypothetical protein